MEETTLVRELAGKSNDANLIDARCQHLTIHIAPSTVANSTPATISIMGLIHQVASQTPGAVDLQGDEQSKQIVASMNKEAKDRNEFLNHVFGIK